MIIVIIFKLITVFGWWDILYCDWFSRSSCFQNNQKFQPVRIENVDALETNESDDKDKNKGDLGNRVTRKMCRHKTMSMLKESVHKMKHSLTGRWLS